MIQDINNKQARVIFVAAGPGDAELITLKGARHLSEAEVILTDRLVNQDILDQHAHKDAKIVYVGKKSYSKTSTSQETINQLLLLYAGKNKRIVRLKGGDTTLFSNIYDELLTLKKHNIAYEIVPGVTSALGAAAYSGIPLTARGYTNGVRFMALHAKDVVLSANWSELAESKDTLVFYMTLGYLNDVVQNLIDHQVSPSVFVSVVEQATTSLQNTYTVPIYEFLAQYGQKDFISPSVVIIGQVAHLNQELGWLPNSNESGEYFPQFATPLLIEQYQKMVG